MTTYIDAAETVMIILTLIAIIYGPIQSVLSDMVRQEQFEKRDSLFELAAAGKISFDSKEYIQCRKKLNTCIRYAHRMTFPRTIFLSYFLNKKGIKKKNIIFSSIKNIETRDKVEKIMKESNRNIAIFMILRSPMAQLLSVFVVLPLAFLCLVFDAVKGVSDITFNILKSELSQLAIEPLAEKVDREIRVACC